MITYGALSRPTKLFLLRNNEVFNKWKIFLEQKIFETEWEIPIRRVLGFRVRTRNVFQVLQIRN